MGQMQLLWAGDVKGHLMCIGHYAGSFTEGMLPCYLSVPPKDAGRGVVPPPTHFTDEAAETLIDHEVTESGWRTGIQLQVDPEPFPANQSVPCYGVKLLKKGKISLDGLELK